MSMSIDIEASDVIRLIQQFLKENNLHRTFETLQEETGIQLNTVDNLPGFVQDIQRGRWENVLKTVVPLRLPIKKLIPLYEQIAMELIEMREIAAARNLVRQTETMQILRQKYPARYLHLEQLLSRIPSDPHEIYIDGLSKEKRRQKIAQELSKEVTSVPPARLLTLLGQSLKWQQHQGLLPIEGGFDLFGGTAAAARVEDDSIPTECYATIQFPRAKRPETAVFSPGGEYLVTGSEDGYIELWNHFTGKLRSDVKYQADGKFMHMSAGVSSLAFSLDGDLLASGCREGTVKIWTIKDGLCVRRFPAAHTQGVTSICFNKSGSQVLTGSFDHTVRLHGLKSGKTLKEYRGHTSFVNSVLFSMDMSKILSASSDGTVKVWDYKSAECLLSLSPQARSSMGTAVPASVSSASLLRLQQVPGQANQVVMCPQLPAVYIMTVEGRVVKRFELPGADDTAPDFVDCAISPRGEYIYAIGTDSTLYCFNVESGLMEHTVKLAEAEVRGITHHPTTNTMAAYNEAGHVSLWRTSRTVT
ncbi:Serine/threonine-protein kinase smu1 [Dimargaris cristalligena]|uniref:WD40 repeat-containing protein SMU1 n=1 Tax=Dimargaris cristalligena TaxID=215637 RepID=A0A4P9ZS11_9FUNG|nr:Serine/threonine-protein kinase smu1 [Dimargaris cristalligena]RKP36346.1 WD40 repeat-containing protein SMU1 [Dimargaris cristalligena]|eukprot:RKP36346.1 WD40 repeat-containing protein SMU1 [Dimargaris cristalligena]